MHPKRAAFTLLELLTVLVIVAILASLLIPIGQKMAAHSEKIKCTANLRNVHAGTSSYIVQHQRWPQIAPASIRTKGYARQWIAALEPYGIMRSSWICPSVQRISHDPDYNQPENVRIDYLATPFDEHPLTPYRWAWQPWFIERGDVHGRGNLIIFSDGKVEELREFVRKRQ